jgi:hypothetical protein
MEEAMYTVNPMYKGFFLPKRSNNGPYNNWPAEIPIKNPVNDKDTWAMEVFRSLAIAGKPGRYISMEKGAKAVNVPKIRIRRT